MPRYVYYCSLCKEDFIVWHDMDELLTECEVCGNSSIHKQVPELMSKKITQQKVGQVVKDFIENSKEQTEEIKKELKNKEYKK